MLLTLLTFTLLTYQVVNQPNPWECTPVIQGGTQD